MQIKDPQYRAIAISCLCNLLKHKSSNVRCNAAKSLGEYGEETDRDLRKKALLSLCEVLANDQEEAYIRCAAIVALREFGEETVPAIVDAANTSDSAVCEQVAKTLGEMAKPRDIEDEPKQVIGDTYINNAGIVNTGSVTTQGNQIGIQDNSSSPIDSERAEVNE